MEDNDFTDVGWILLGTIIYSLEAKFDHFIEFIVVVGIQAWFGIKVWKGFVCRCHATNHILSVGFCSIKCDKHISSCICRYFGHPQHVSYLGDHLKQQFSSYALKVLLSQRWLHHTLTHYSNLRKTGLLDLRITLLEEAWNNNQTHIDSIFANRFLNGPAKFIDYSSPILLSDDKIIEFEFDSKVSWSLGKGIGHSFGINAWLAENSTSDAVSIRKDRLSK